mmetsp:Transcript_17618/g.49903  ORF Transcript_17618/g.49903 Transcript_17618/m.49903 type:complete len:314 (+) Transcript_17618:115-1056(+)
MGDRAENPPAEDFELVHCNYVSDSGEPCNLLLEDAWVTACSHVFCREHAKEWFQGHEDCPICRDGKVKCIRMNFSKGRFRQQRLLLIGMPPNDILQATQTALNFWIDQKALEYQQRTEYGKTLRGREASIEESLKAKLGEIEASCKELEMEQRQLQQKIDDTEKESGQVQQHLQRLKRESMETDDSFHSLQSRVADARMHECFKRPLTETPKMGPGTPLPTPARQCPTPLHAKLGESARRYEQGGLRGSLAQGAPRGGARGSEQPGPRDAYLAQAVPRGGAHGTPGPPLSNRRLPTLTPGFFGDGRVTKRRIT